jgi:hypothetical protein
MDEVSFSRDLSAFFEKPMALKIALIKLYNLKGKKST